MFYKVHHLLLLPIILKVKSRLCATITFSKSYFITESLNGRGWKGPSEII